VNAGAADREEKEGGPGSSPGAAELRAVHSRMIEAVLCGGGLARVAALAAEAASAEIAIVVPRLGEPARTGPGETAVLAAYVTSKLDGRPVPVPAGVGAEADVAAGGEVVGAVLLLGPRPGAHGLEVLHMAALACLTELAVDQAREEVEQNLRGSFLEDMRTRADLPEDEILRRAARLGCDLSGGAVALCAEISGPRPRLALGLVADDEPDALAEVTGDRLYALLPARRRDAAGVQPPEATLEAARRLAGRLERHGLVGFSSFCSRAAHLPRAIGEAELVLDVLQRSALPADADVGSGTYRLLFRVLASRPEEIRSFYEDTVEPLVRYDDQYGTDLVGTLDAYLVHNGSTGDTARAIFAHRHTVAYRLDRIKELTKLDPNGSEDRERLGLGLKAMKLVGARPGERP
jgi:sugar diacid utilization regulator